MSDLDLRLPARMRICLVSQQYPPETARGGIGTQTHAKAHGLSRRGHEVVVLSSAVAHEPGSVTMDGPVRVVRLPEPDDTLEIRTDAARWVTWSVAVAASLERLNRETPFDLVEFAEYGAEGYVYFLNRAAWARIPSVVQLHGPLVMLAHTIGWPEPGSELYRAGTAMEGACLRLADAVYTSGACSAGWVAREYGLDPRHLPVLHTGVDTTLFRPAEKPDPRPTIAFVGHVAASKGADLLVDAALELARELPELRVLLIGPCDEGFRSRIDASLADAGHPDLVEWRGFVPREQLPEELGRAWLLAVPSRYEGGPGLVYLEGMAMGLPAIACAGSGAAEVVIPDVNGCLVQPGDGVALGSCLRRLLTDPSYRGALAEGALRYAREEADSAICIARIERFYLDVIARTAHK